MKSFTNDFEKARVMSRVLTLYYSEGKNQADIAKLLELSTAKVNRLIKQARDEGMVEIVIRTPFQHLFDLAHQLQTVSEVPEAVIVPKIAEHPEAVLQTVGRAAANYLVERLRDGDTICISGGKSLYAIVQAIETKRKFDVKVVPATGGVQGRHYTDVNYLAAQLADRLGGKAYQLHAPLFVDSSEERNALYSMRQTKEILDMARNAQIALHGIGAVISSSSSYFEMRNTSLSEDVKQEIIEQEGGIGDLFAHIYDLQGKTCAQQFNDKVVGLTPEELHNIPINIGVAATADKAVPIYGALKGNHLKTLITDETTAISVLELYDKDKTLKKDKQ